ncbi:MAG: hypothetical protein GY778_15285 [bacterium]|nr:hypothetical protein [bacterium]
MADQPHDSHHHRTLAVPDAPLDAANQSLADALRASFGVLKAIMIILVVLFAFSGLKCVQEHQRAVLLRFGKLSSDPEREPGLAWALPYPVDETLRVGVTAERLSFFDMHTAQQGSPFGGLDPARDGALLTADKGLVHVKWSLVYRVDDLANFVRTVSDANDDKTKELIGTLLEHAAVRAATRYTAAEIAQTRTDELAREVKREINTALADMGTGVVVTTVEIPNAAVPEPTRRAFLAVSASENQKNMLIQAARQQANKMLNETAGGIYPNLIDKLDELAVARADGDTARADALQDEVDRMLEEGAAGAVGVEIREAYAWYTEAVQGIRGDVEQFQMLLAEYRQSPTLLINRLWQETRRRIMSNTGVTKYYLPPGQKEVRLVVGPDPEAQRQAEIDKLTREATGATAEGGGVDFKVVTPDEEK